MVAVLVGLKLRLLRNGLRRSVWKVVGLILGSLYGLGIVIAAVVGLTALRFVDVQITASVTVIVFTALTLGWLVFSVLIFGVDETVDPARFALLPVRAEQLAPGLLVGALIGLPGIGTVLASLGLIGAWSTSVGTVLAAVVAVPIGVVLCVLWTRVATGLLAQVLASRRFRDVAIVVLTLFFVSVGLVFSVISNLAARNPDVVLVVLHTVGAVLGWTPFGWVWAVPAAVAQGQWLGAVVRLLLAVGLTAALYRGWVWVLARNLTVSLDSGGQSKQVKQSTTLDRLLPATPAGAVAGRCLRYWRRDPRYLAALVSIIVLPVILVGTQLLSPVRSTALIALTPVLLGFMLAPSLASDLAYDGTAISTHVLTGLRGRDDRAGRLLSALIILGPIMLVVLVACAVVSGRYELVPVSVGLTIGFALTGLGVAAWIGVIFPGKAPPPGSNPFSAGGGGGVQAAISFGASSGLTTLLSLPLIAVAVGSLWISWLGWVALVVGLVGGAVVFRLGIIKGGALLDRRWPDVLQQLESA